MLPSSSASSSAAFFFPPFFGEAFAAALRRASEVPGLATRSQAAIAAFVQLVDDLRTLVLDVRARLGAERPSVVAMTTVNAGKPVEYRWL